MMNKLNLLLPDKKTGYLLKGRGQQVNYLQLPEELDLEALQQDIKGGAVQFTELAELARKKNTSRFVIIRAFNEEEGLMAASYLAGVYNHRDNVESMLEGDDFENEYFTLEMAEAIRESEHRALKEEPTITGNDTNGDAEDDNASDGIEWPESPLRIPIICSGELLNYQSGFDELHFGTFEYVSARKNNSYHPYWTSCKKEPVIIIHKQIFDEYMSAYNELSDKLERFADNRHVYFVSIPPETIHSIGYDEFKEDGENNWLICDIALEYTAPTVSITASNEDRTYYYRTIFENHVLNNNAELAEDISIADITNQIMKMRKANKSQLLSKAVSYVIENVKNERESLVLTNKDFDVLKRFHSIGLNGDTDQGEKAADRLEKQIMGMKEIKDRVWAAVQVLKMNQRREQAGLHGNVFHNVYAYVGAPGTAKTTVARLMGELMAEEKLLKGRRFISINGAELKGMYVGHTAPKVAEIFRNNDIIFIDEAYSLTAAQSNGDYDQYSQEALAQLAIELEKHGSDRLVIFAGYGGSDVEFGDNKMLQFINANPGIRSRINEVFYFPSYNTLEMTDITLKLAENRQYIIDKDAVPLIRSFFESRRRDQSFGNGREARNLVEHAAKAAAVRLHAIGSELSRELLEELTYDDISTAINRLVEQNKQIQGRKRRNCGFHISEDKGNE